MTGLITVSFLVLESWSNRFSLANLSRHLETLICCPLTSVVSRRRHSSHVSIFAMCDSCRVTEGTCLMGVLSSISWPLGRLKGGGTRGGGTVFVGLFD